MTGVYSFPERHFFRTNLTRIECISSVMSRNHFLEIQQNLYDVDNMTQPHSADLDYDRACKVRSLMNIVRENFQKKNSAWTNK